MLALSYDPKTKLWVLGALSEKCSYRIIFCIQKAHQNNMCVYFPTTWLLYRLTLPDLTPERWHLIVKYKTSFYSFYLSVAFAMTLAGVTDQDAYNAARNILIEMGVYFQAQDDFLDCYATPEVLGKVGTDIADKKCGWLFTKAYHELANEEQKSYLDTHYGNCTVGSPEEVKIKELYTELGLKELYARYEQDSYDKIMAMKGSEAGETLRNAGVPWIVFEKFLAKVYKRSH